jgi:hypothetical protein
VCPSVHAPDRRHSPQIVRPICRWSLCGSWPACPLGLRESPHSGGAVFPRQRRRASAPFRVWRCLFGCGRMLVARTKHAFLVACSAAGAPIVSARRGVMPRLAWRGPGLLHALLAAASAEQSRPSLAWLGLAWPRCIGSRAALCVPACLGTGWLHFCRRFARVSRAIAPGGPRSFRACCTASLIRHSLSSARRWRSASSRRNGSAAKPSPRRRHVPPVVRAVL